MEYHPRINKSKLPLKESRIILGSFPTWTLSNPDSNSKRIERIKNSEMSYFYGSSKNVFWDWYHDNIDLRISKDNANSIRRSLNEKSIGITDLILTCLRKEKSALDKHLTNRTYNHQFFEYPNKGDTLRIMCTSKGVMNEMLLNRSFFNLHPKLKINSEKSNIFQSHFIKKIKGDIDLIRNPFYNFIDVKFGGKIECIALPSPGSPYRRLVDFGFNTGNADDYLNNYIKSAFEWFLRK